MAGKKLSDLDEVNTITDNDEFVFVDKEGTGQDSGIGGKNVKIKFMNLKNTLSSSGGIKGEPGIGEKGEKGESGSPGPTGEPGIAFDYDSANKILNITSY